MLHQYPEADQPLPLASSPSVAKDNTLFIRASSLLGDISYPGLDFELRREGTHVSVRVSCPQGVDAETGKGWHWNGRWWRLSPYMSDSEIVGTCFKAVLTALEHEAREVFKFKGSAVYDAHLSVHQLAKLRADKGALDVR